MWYLILALILIFLILGAYKNLTNHQKKEYLVVERKILESANKCYLDGNCTGEITLKILYDKDYLPVQVNPFTKENMDDEICIKYEKEEAKFCNK